MQRRPCNCGDALSGAEVYRNKETGAEVEARKMNRDFVTIVNNKMTAGKNGDWLARDEHRNRFVYTDSDFTRLYEKVSK